MGARTSGSASACWLRLRCRREEGPGSSSDDMSEGCGLDMMGELVSDGGGSEGRLHSFAHSLAAPPSKAPSSRSVSGVGGANHVVGGLACA